jgi:predicted flap endonuclease-1-like 5' DNA nuclease
VKRVARILGILGGLGAIAWAMRDRLVSVAISREPQPPAFKVPTANPGGKVTDDKPAPASVPTAGGEITSITGIGPVYATRLETVGISTLDQLAGARPEQVAAAAEVPLSRAVGWVDTARNLTASD